METQTSTSDKENTQNEDGEVGQGRSHRARWGRGGTASDNPEEGLVGLGPRLQHCHHPFSSLKHLSFLCAPRLPRASAQDSWPKALSLIAGTCSI